MSFLTTLPYGENQFATDDDPIQAGDDASRVDEDDAEEEEGLIEGKIMSLPLNIS